MADELSLANLLVLWIKSTYDLKGNDIQIYDSAIISKLVQRIVIESVGGVDNAQHQFVEVIVCGNHALVWDYSRDHVLLDARKLDFFDKIYKYLTPALAIELDIMPNERS